MRIVYEQNSPIRMTSVNGPTYSIGGPRGRYYQHQVMWEPQAGCRKGFIAQKVERDVEFSFGKVSGILSKSWEWEPKVVSASYWEIWEVVEGVARVVGQRGRMRVYPAVTREGQIATSHGLRTAEAIKLDGNKRPHPAPQDYEYLAHDIFQESRPRARADKAIKGMFKIKGTVYFLPNCLDDREREHPWVTTFLHSAERNQKIYTPYDSFYSGGALWQQPGGLAAPHGGTKIITRYEAGEFYDVQPAHITPADCSKKPPIEQYCRPCSYPGQICNRGPFPLAAAGPAAVPAAVAVAV